MPNSNRQSSGSGLKTAAAFGIGAVAGALAAGALWFMGQEEESSPSPRQSQQYYSTNHPSHQTTTPPPNSTDEKDDDEKDGTVKMCEICFVAFSELKECGVQIVSTPCGHVYCRDCIVGALSVKPECPHCRSEVHKRTLRRLYL